MTDAALAYSSPVVMIGGAPPEMALIDRLCGMGLPLIAADGGADVLLQREYRPDAVIGDLDSVRDPEQLQALGVPLHHVAEQDTTDFEKCLARVEAPGVLATGFLGGRSDHTLATMSVLARFPAGRVIVLGGPDLILHCPARIALDLPEGVRFSLYPMTRVRGHSSGLHWALQDVTLDPLGLIGTSNVTLGPVELEITEGTALLILPMDHLNTLRKALKW